MLQAHRWWIILSSSWFSTAIADCISYQFPHSWSNHQQTVYLNLNNYAARHLLFPPQWRVIATYHLLAGGQFTQAQFMHFRTSYPQLIDLDLRAEYHAFNAGLPFSLISLPNNDISHGNNLATILAREELLTSHLMPAQPQLAYYQNNLKTTPTPTTPKLCLTNQHLISEAKLMHNYQVPYYRINALDHVSPSLANLDQLLQFYDHYLATNPQQWVYVHCLAGKGRTTTAITLLVMLKQQTAGILQPFASLISSMEQVNHYKLRPNCPINDQSYRCQGKWQRFNTLYHFYQFVQHRQPGQSYTSYLSTITSKTTNQSLPQ